VSVEYGDCPFSPIIRAREMLLVALDEIKKPRPNAAAYAADAAYAAARYAAYAAYATAADAADATYAAVYAARAAAAADAADAEKKIEVALECLGKLDAVWPKPWYRPDCRRAEEVMPVRNIHHDGTSALMCWKCFEERLVQIAVDKPADEYEERMRRIEVVSEATARKEGWLL